MEHEIKVIKMNKNDVSGTGIIWDKLYIVPKKDKHLIKKIFSFSVVMEKTPALEEKIINSLKKKTYGRTKDKVEYSEFDITRTDDPKKETDDIASLFAGEHYIVIPILGRYDKTKKKLVPRYISAKKHLEDIETKRKRMYANTPESFPADAYIQLPDKELRPICMACQNSMSFVAGKCTIGEKECYQNLIFGNKSVFKENLEAGKPIVQENFKDLEEEIKEVANELF